MSFISVGGGAPKWSTITIDADKDMSGKGLSNVKQVAAAMVGGDLIAKGLGGILVRVPAGIANTVLTSAGPGILPTWAPGGLYLNRYFPAQINLSMPTATKNTVRTYTKTKTGIVTSVYVTKTGDDPANMVKLLSPAITLPKSATKNTTRSHTQSKTITVPTHYDLVKVVDGAFRSPAGVDTNETAAAQSAAVNDMSLPPQTPGANDAYKFGAVIKFDSISLVLGTQGAGVWTITWEYWNGAWVALAGVTDGTTHFRAAPGTYTVSFTRPGDWAVQNLGGLGNQYYIRARVSAYTSRVTQPLGSQVFCQTTT